ncbi:MAG: glycosyltransferase [Candidatus Omnitrophica bacterium]|nr:glycosyltransferase [Candidatus Omnitrophota bacterium]
MPCVSVIIPTYNRKGLLQEALESVFAQTFRDYELIVIDDGSTDGTKEAVLSRWGDRVRYFTQPNAGISAARNAGIREAQGTYVAFLDSDDTWRPDKLALQVDFMNQNPRTGLLATRLARYELGSQHSQRLCPPTFPSGFLELLNGENNVPTSTVMVRRNCFEETGCFDSSLPIAEDWDLWLRIASRYEIACLDQVLAEHRDHLHKTTRDLEKTYEGYWRFYEKIFRAYQVDLTEPRLVFKKSQAFCYLYGVTMLRRRADIRGLILLIRALYLSPDLGTYFLGDSSGRWSRCRSLFKPYAVIVWGVLKVILKFVTEPVRIILKSLPARRQLKGPVKP